MLKPHQLRPGDKVATVSLSWGGAGIFPHRYDAGKKQYDQSKSRRMDKPALGLG